MGTGWVYWTAMQSESKAAMKSWPAVQISMGKECPHFQRILKAARSIFHRLHADLQVLTESPSAACDVELKKVRDFLVKSEKIAHEVMKGLLRREGLDEFGITEIRAIAKLPRISRKQVLLLLRQFQHPSEICTPIAVTERSRGSIQVRDYPSQVHRSAGATVDLPVHAYFFLIPD